MTLANQITFSRLGMIPVFTSLVWFYSPEREWVRWAAVGVYVVAALSDVLDGYVARRFKQRTKLGTRLDPLADKLIVNLGFVFLAANDYFGEMVPLWFPVVVLSRDVGIVMGAFLINECYGPVKVAPRVLGKLTTTFQMATLVAVLLRVSFAYPLLLVTVVMCVLSYADYLYFGTRQLEQQQQVKQDAG